MLHVTDVLQTFIGKISDVRFLPWDGPLIYRLPAIDFCQACHDIPPSGMGNIGTHKDSHRFAIVRHPLSLMLIRRLSAFVAVTDAWTMDTLREWHRNLLSLRYANWNESSKPDYYGEENESQEDLSDTDDLAHVTSAHSDGAVQDEAALAAEGPLTEGAFIYSEDMA